MRPAFFTFERAFPDSKGRSSARKPIDRKSDQVCYEDQTPDLEREAETIFNLDDRHKRKYYVEHRHQKTGERGNPQPNRRLWIDRPEPDQRDREHYQVSQRVKDTRRVP